MTRTICALVLIGAAITIGYSQETASEYVSPSEAIPTGKASQDAGSIGEPRRTYERKSLIARRKQRLDRKCSSRCWLTIVLCKM